jgi:hypothetical protein
MRVPVGILITIFILTIGMFAFWAWALKHAANILEFEHPSRDIRHAIEKKLFIDTLYIVHPDTIRTNSHERIDILPKSSWIEKTTYWKSGMMDLDSIGFNSDIVWVIGNFNNFMNGKPWKPENDGFHVGDFRDKTGNKQSVYMDNEKTQLSFKIPLDQLADTFRVATGSNEQIILVRRIDAVEKR